MFFNSFNFLFFIVPVLILFYLTNRFISIKAKNIFLLLVSYLFYGLFDFRFCGILLFVTIINYLTIIILKKKRKNKAILSLSIVFSLLPLAFFKYTNFILNDVLSINTDTFKNLILPVGISFFTFQAISYTIDCYRGKETTIPGFFDFALFVSFFPCLLSGPIERARNMMPQFANKQTMNANTLMNGLQLFIWGVFQKNVVADNIAWYVDSAYRGFSVYSASTLWLAILLYSIQIYCDFAGYSNMAIGVGRMMGFKIMKNFDFPYFSSSIREFWKKWHISLTSWLTEYVYFSLGGNRVSIQRWICNIMIVFIVSGIWHGAAWTFIIWGGIHGIYQIFEHFIIKKQSQQSKTQRVIMGGVLYIIVSVAWLLFRSDSLEQALSILSCSISNPIGVPNYFTLTIFLLLLIALFAFAIMDWLLYKRKITILDDKSNPFLWSNLIFSVVSILLIETLGQTGNSFVYFQF